MKNADARYMLFPKNKIFTKNEDKAYLRDRLVFNVTEDILVAMESLGISKVELAKKLNKTKSYVSQTLSGERNMTLGTLSDICFVLGIEPEIKISAQIKPENINSHGMGFFAVKKVTKPLRLATEKKFDELPWMEACA